MSLRFVVVALLAASLAPCCLVRAEDAPPPKKDAPAAPAAPAGEDGARKAPREGGAYKKQAEAASATATFATIAKTNEAYTAALDAHDLDGAKGKVGAEGAFKGTVTGTFERPGFLIVNFDKDYKKTVSAVLRSKGFGAFPNLQTIVGKDVVVSGKFTLHQDRAQIQLESPEQIRIAE